MCNEPCARPSRVQGRVRGACKCACVDLPARTTLARELGVHGLLSHNGELVKRELGHRLTLKLVEEFDDRARSLLVHQLLWLALLLGLG